MSRTYRILHLLPYSRLYPPGNGGQLRSFHLLRQLARRHEVTAFLSAAPEACEDMAKVLPAARIRSCSSFSRSRDVFDALPSRFGRALRYRWLRRDPKGPASAYFLEAVPGLAGDPMRGTYDIIVCEHLEALNLAPLVRRFNSKAKILYDAHNIDHRLIPNVRSRDYQRVRRLESTLYQSSDGFLACSEDDRVDLERLNEGRIKGWCIPNGVDMAAHSFDPNPAKENLRQILFCGSLDYPPNRDGLIWFHEQIWPRISRHLEGATFVVIGRGGGSKCYDRLRSDPTVNFVGEVADVTDYYRNAAVSVVPLLSGSGTRLKVLEAWALGVPVVSTAIGVEGLGARSGHDCLIADSPDEISASVLNLMNGTQAYHTIREMARERMNSEFDWDIIGWRLDAVLREVVSSRPIA